MDLRVTAGIAVQIRIAIGEVEVAAHHVTSPSTVVADTTVSVVLELCARMADDFWMPDTPFRQGDSMRSAIRVIIPSMTVIPGTAGIEGWIHDLPHTLTVVQPDGSTACGERLDYGCLHMQFTFRQDGIHVVTIGFMSDQKIEVEVTVIKPESASTQA